MAKKRSELAAEIGKVLPQAVDIEEIVLGSLLLEPGIATTVFDRISREVFYKEANQHIFDAIEAVINEGAKPDLVLVMRRLRNKGVLDICGGPYYLSKLTDKVASTANIDFHCRVLMQQALKRAMILKSWELQKESYEDNVDVFDIVDRLGQWYNGLNSGVMVTSQKINLKTSAKEENVILSFLDKKFLTVGNISGIIAPYGTGKSNLIAAILSGLVNVNCDSIGFKGHLFGKGAFHADTESSEFDAVQHFQRMARRIGIENHPSFVQGDDLKGISYERYKGIASWKDRRRALEQQIRTERFKLIILDGLTDFMGDPNSLSESQDLVGWLGAAASKFGLGVLCSIHDNVAPKGSENKGRPRGHIGSELARKAESLLYLRKSKQDSKIREITNDFEFQKFRNASDSAFSQYMFWDIDKDMFVSTTLDELPEEGEFQKLEKMVLMIFDNGVPLNYSDLVKEFMSRQRVKATTAKARIKDAVELGVLFQLEDKKYYSMQNYINTRGRDDEAPF